METITLQRSGKGPLQFNGELVARSEGERQAHREHARYHDVAIYRTEGGSFVLWISYVTKWAGEVGHTTAEVIQDEQEMLTAFDKYDPTAHVVGFPPHENFREKQERLLDDIAARWKSQVSDVLNSDEFAEQVK
jgi:hypothetical protein